MSQKSSSEIKIEAIKGKYFHKDLELVDCTIWHKYLRYGKNFTQAYI